jgi:signal transduction histidine kinase/DNA-binding NarL/FixJ family response regulator
MNQKQVKLEIFVKSFQRSINLVASLFIIIGAIYTTLSTMKYRFETRILEMNSEIGLLLDALAKELIVEDQEGANIVVKHIADRYLNSGESIFLDEIVDSKAVCRQIEYVLGRSKICWKPLKRQVQVTWMVPNVGEKYRITMLTSLSSVGITLLNFTTITLILVIVVIYIITRLFLHSLNENLIKPISQLHNILQSNNFDFTSNSRFQEVQSLVAAVHSLSLREKREIELAKYQAIAQMTQQLAHDVRKPFSMLKTGLNLLQASSHDAERLKSNLTFLVSEVERATKSVDGMLTDVMEVGSNSTILFQEPISPESLIETSLNEIFRIYPKSNISFSYQLYHSTMVNVHLKKVNRVFSNILANAVQAINFSGSIWFKTKMVGEFVQFCIGNTGSFIPEQSRQNIFDAFFTSGKKCGTGLGLAIAQKVVQAHGGKIWCESFKSPEHPDGKVEFFFDLPVAKGVLLDTNANLPKHSNEITQIITIIGEGIKSKSDSEFNRNENLLYYELLQSLSSLPRPLGILLIDDELIYRSALAGWISESNELKLFCGIYQASDSFEALEIMIHNKIDLVITDIDLGPRSLNGFDFVKKLSALYSFSGSIFLHSNRIVPDDHRKASELGADGFLPKPIAKGQLFKLILHSTQKLVSTSTLVGRHIPLRGESYPHQKNKVKNISPENTIAIIDDEDIFRNQWPIFLKNYRTICYSTAEDFLNDWDIINSNLVAVITDRYLGTGMDGIKLGTLLRKKSPHLTIFLSSNGVSLEDHSNIFDIILDKDAREESQKILSYLRLISNT